MGSQVIMSQPKSILKSPCQTEVTKSVLRKGSEGPNKENHAALDKKIEVIKDELADEHWDDTDRKEIRTKTVKARIPTGHPNILKQMLQKGNSEDDYYDDES